MNAPITQPHITLMLANANIGMACFRLTKALDVPSLHHELPGLLLDLTTAYEALLDRVSEEHPDITQALAAGFRSTQTLALAEALDTHQERAA